MARFKTKMRYLAPEWADKIWDAAQARNRGAGAEWLLPLAVTGVRPASLERGITFDLVHDHDGAEYIRAKSFDAKILKDFTGAAIRGQDEVQVCWRITPPADAPHRPNELWAILQTLQHSEQKRIAVTYDVDGISTQIRELSKEIWPRKQYQVSAICYRELLSSCCKDAGMSASDIAKVMGHLSTESQGRYSSGTLRSSSAPRQQTRLFSHIAATNTVRVHRSPMQRFKNSAANLNRKRLALSIPC
ncbi:hypothetical protein [Pseudoduganella violacea]|uniref:Tyrosine-type recombinase/integrase n=1 Tax=Pseudoduganella violacea TaxID=1715466 RepID=A0A7W5FUY7_9BURK|nr:hypothetical protein [Pseudoduganella violacea]MBB3119663.1 hypothetical protein [Pseudoduganella violacea]